MWIVPLPVPPPPQGSYVVVTIPGAGRHAYPLTGADDSWPAQIEAVRKATGYPDDGDAAFDAGWRVQVSRDIPVALLADLVEVWHP